MQPTVRFSARNIFRIVYSVAVLVICYLGSYAAINDILDHSPITMFLAVLSCLDFGLALIAARFEPKEPGDIWCLFAIIFLIAAFSSTLTWWALGVKGYAREVSVFGAGFVLILRCIAINFIGGDDEHGLFI